MAVKERAVIFTKWYNKQNFIAAFLKCRRRYKWQRKDDGEL
jgi:hypothetical protein